MKSILFAALVASQLMVVSSASACRCAIPGIDSLIRDADAILTGASVWTMSEGLNNYSAVRMDRILHVSGRLDADAKAGLEKSVREGTVTFFRGRLSERSTSCPGTDVSLPEGTRMIYVARADEYGMISLVGESINHCSTFSTFLTAGNSRYEELSKALEEI